MGFNHKAAGYVSPVDMVAAFCDSEAAGLEAMIRFIESEGLDDELRRHDWSAFARGYNGSGYANHGYHTKLAAAFKRGRQSRMSWCPPIPRSASVRAVPLCASPRYSATIWVSDQEHS